jgi:protein-tyrosine-phosphatase
MAEGLFREMVKGIEGMEVSSAGVAAGDGERPSGDAVAAMGQLGIAIGKGRSRLLTEEILAEATDVFVMTRGHLEAVTRYFPWAAEKTFLLREFEAEEGGGGEDVPDPIGMGMRAYVECREAIQRSLYFE